MNMTFDKIKKISDKVLGTLPPVLQDSKAELQYQVRRVVKEVFTEMNLVTREEFDVQAELLVRTRIKLEALEKECALLVQRHKNIQK